MEHQEAMARVRPSTMRIPAVRVDGCREEGEQQYLQGMAVGGRGGT